LTSLTPRLAQHIISRVGEAGQPPEYGLSYINVGNQHYLDILATEYLDRLLDGNRGSAFKLVQGYYGGGKTHFLHCLRDLAWMRGFLCSLVQLSPQECPYEDPLKVYRAVVSQLAGPPAHTGDAPTRGIGDLLRDFAEGLAQRQTPEERAAWLKRISRKVQVDSVTFRRAVVAFLQCCWDGDSAGEALLESWLRADPVPRQDLKPYGIYEVIDHNNAFASLRSLCQTLTGFGYPGLLLMFDEVDRNLSLSTRRIAALGDNLRQVIDLCGSAQLPGVLFLYAVPPEFLRLVVPEYPALDQRLRSPLPLSRISPQSTLIDLEKLELQPEELLLAIGQKLLKVFQVAEQWTATEAIQQGNLQALARACAQYSFEVGHRRTFVKSWVAFLHQQKQNGESWMSEEMAENMLTHGVTSPDQAHDFLDV
jgi:hypothetical protein